MASGTVAISVVVVIVQAPWGEGNGWCGNLTLPTPRLERILSAAMTIASGARAMDRTIGLSLMKLLAIALIGCGVADTVSAQDADGSTRFRDLPKGWAVDKTIVASPAELAAMSKNLG